MKIKTVTDGGSEPNTPSISELRESQRKGSQGNGTQPQNYNESLCDFDQCCSDCPCGGK